MTHQIPEADQIRLGVVGCGRISQVAHLPAIAKAGSVELRAVCDASPQVATAMAERYGVSAHTETAALLNDDIDAVVVAVPDQAHAVVAREALLAGRHVLIEKPIAETITQAEELRELACSSGLQLQVASMKRYDPGVQYAAGAVRRLGSLRSVTGWYRVMARLRAPVEATLFPPLVVDPAIEAREAEYKTEHRSQHLLVTHGVHTFDLLRYLGGDYEITGAVLSDNGRDYSWHALGRYAGAAALSIEVTASVHAEWSEGFDLYGDLGHVRLRCPFPFTRQASSVRYFDEASQAYATPVFGDTDPYKRQVEAFAQAIMAGTPATPSAGDGIEALRVADAIRHAAQAAGPA
jgi:predicted dehydrogenase